MIKKRFSGTSEVKDTEHMDNDTTITTINYEGLFPVDLLPPPNNQQLSHLSYWPQETPGLINSKIL